MLYCRSFLIGSVVGKALFVPLRYIDRKTGNINADKRIASLYNDLESLYLVAVCCYLGDVPWANSHGSSRYNDCSKASGIQLRTRFSPFPAEWNFLNDVRNCLNKHDSTVNELVCTFGLALK